MDSNMDSDILMDGLAVGEMLKIMQEKKIVATLLRNNIKIYLIYP